MYTSAIFDLTNILTAGVAPPRMVPVTERRPQKSRQTSHVLVQLFIYVQLFMPTQKAMGAPHQPLALSPCAPPKEDSNMS